MKIAEIILRQQLILTKLRKGTYSFKELSHFLQEESEIQSLDFNFSQRSFQREIKDIYTIYGIDIVNNSENKYEIREDAQSEIQKRMMEVVELLQILRTKDSFKEALLFESRNPKGTHFIKTLLEAIKSKKQIQFNYQKYWEGKTDLRTVSPLALKENRQRWYLVGIDSLKADVRIFALDRIKELEIMKIDSVENEIDVADLFHNSFGVLSPNGEEPINIELTFTAFQAKYIKSLPLHHSQTVIKDEEKVVFGMYIVPTFDFIMELLSFGDSLLDIKPLSLKQNVLNAHSRALEMLKK